MNFRKLFFALSILCGSFSNLFAEKLVIDLNKKPITNGFADVGDTKYITKKTVIIDDKTYPNPIKKRIAFTKAIASSASTIILDGDVDLSDGKVTDDDHSYFDEFDTGSHKRKHDDFMYPIASNKTIIGRNNARIKFGGLSIDEGKNIIIRNITFWDAHGSTEYSTEYKEESKASADALVIWDRKSSIIPTNIWIDHCTFTDGKCDDMRRNFNHDGQIDICGAKNLTISYCEFTNHDKVMLVGSSDKMTVSKERQVTLHHNYFHHTTQRTPRSRGTQMHIYNNVYDDIGVEGNPGYLFGPGIASQYIVENNYIGSHRADIVSYFDKSDADDFTFSKFFQSGNSVEITDSDIKWDGPEKTKNFNLHFVSSKEEMNWKIPYKYDMEDYQNAFDNVKANVGANQEVEIIGLK